MNPNLILSIFHLLDSHKINKFKIFFDNLYCIKVSIKG